MVSQSLLSSLGFDDTSEAVGKKLSLTLKLDGKDYEPKKPFVITGVIEVGNGSVLYIPQSVYAEAEVKDYEQVKVVATNQESVPDIRRQIETFGYQTSSPLDTLEQVNQFFQFFNVIIASFGGVGMFIAIIGIFNTLTIALLERTREIGLMIALGARRGDVRKLFITEALIMSCSGGVLGIVLAILTGILANLSLNHLSFTRGVTERFSLFATPLWLILAALIFAALVGVAVSYIPARRAGKILPIDALRRE